MTGNELRSIAIVGGGTAGWMTAAALAQVLGTRHVAVTLIESEEIGTVGVGEATIPLISLFNKLLGIDENEFVAATNGSFKLGIEFVDWLRPGHRYFHPFGTYGVDIGTMPFLSAWQRLRQAGRGSDLASYSICTAAARNNRFCRPDPRRNSPIAQISYAFHFDAVLYAQYLRRYAEARGVSRIDGRVVDVALDSGNGFIESVRLASGEQVAADLFIDCSGFRGLLIEQALGTGFEDWSRWLVNDRAVAVPSASLGDLPPFTRSTARPAGWQWRIPLQHRVGNGYVYSSQFLSDDDAIADLLANIEGAPLAEPRMLRFRTGRRQAFWVRNCVALGLSAGFMEPLESTSIHMIQTGIARLLEMLPDRRFAETEIARYNHLVAREFEEIRDFLILHYHATERTDSPYWDYVRTMDIPDGLADRIRIYQANGRVFRDNEELFSRTSWMAVMDGQGLTASGFDQLALAATTEELAQYLDSIEAAVERDTLAMPRHIDFLREYCGASI